MGRHVGKERQERYYTLLFNLIDKIKLQPNLDYRDKNFLIETLKEIIGRIEHHELGPDCPATDIDFLETSYGRIVAIVLKSRSQKPPTNYEKEKSLIVANALHVPLFIEYSEINEKTRQVGRRKTIEWLQKALVLINIDKKQWQEFHHFIRQEPSEIQLIAYFDNHKESLSKFMEIKTNE